MRLESGRGAPGPLPDGDKLYVDPRLVGSRRRYVGFLKDLERRGLLTYGSWVHETVGTFFVKKKSGRQRLIVDARRTNARFGQPPHVDLLTADGVGQARDRGRRAGGAATDLLWHGGCQGRFPQDGDARVAEAVLRFPARHRC